MNPSLPGTRQVCLGDGRVTPTVITLATIIRDYPPTLLPAVETEWAPARVTLTAAIIAAGGAPEHGHWDWRNKVRAVESGRNRLIAVECEGQCQGLMAVFVPDRPSLLTPGHNVLYVDYLESAPWNVVAPGHPPRFLGAGTVLIGEAVLLAIERGLGGRVGLHSLPQAQAFYAQRCRMTRIGPDEAYYDLVYFEYAEGVGPEWRIARGLL